jgi:hypothetical protein
MDTSLSALAEGKGPDHDLSDTSGRLYLVREFQFPSFSNEYSLPMSRQGASSRLKGKSR